MGRGLARRALLGAGLAGACSTTAQNEPAGARETLLAFLHAFENCDLAAMQAAFAPDATSFDRALPGASESGASGDLGPYRRAAGMPAGMRHLAETLPRTQAGPPYLSLTPVDLLIQGDAGVAVCSFHLEDAHGLGRRTIVLQRRAGAWKIIHIHASNVGS